MQIVRRIFLFELGGNPNKKNARNETVLHCVCAAERGATLTYVQQQRRYDCLQLVLLWTGPTLADGRVEKAALPAKDEVGVWICTKKKKIHRIFVISDALRPKRIRHIKRRHSACFAYRRKYWAHCATRYVSMATYLIMTSPGYLRPRTFVCYAVLPLQYWVIYVL